MRQQREPTAGFFGGRAACPPWQSISPMAIAWTGRVPPPWTIHMFDANVAAVKSGATEREEG
jgi:hypothetical protein